MKKTERTRLEIIQKAAPLFNKKGVIGTSLSDLEKATGLSKGSIYGNFANKDEVAVGAFRYNIQQFQKGIREEMQLVQHPADKLLAYLTFYRKQYEYFFDNGGCPIVNTAMDTDDTMPLLHQEVNELIEFWRQDYIRIIRKGQAKGHFKLYANAEYYAGLFMTLIQGGVVLSKSTGDMNYLFNAFDQYEKLVEELKA